MCPIDANTMTSRIVTRSCTAASGNGEDGSQSDCQDSKVDLCNQGATDGEDMLGLCLATGHLAEFQTMDNG